MSQWHPAERARSGLRVSAAAFCQVIPSAVLNLWYTVAALAEGGRPLDAVAKQISRAGELALVAPSPCGHGPLSRMLAM